MLVLVSLVSVLTVTGIVFHLQEAGQLKAEASPPHDIRDVSEYELDYHLNEQRVQGRTGSEFCSPGLSRP